MKTQRLFFLLTVFLIYACSTKHPKQETQAVLPAETAPVKIEIKKGELVPSALCLNDANQSYAYYLPKNYSDSVKYPVIIFFDPHGSGSYPVGLYKSLAEEFGYILMGSNNSKNGLQFEQTNGIVSSLVSEASTRFSADAKRISLAGFSGGSKVVLVGASKHPELLSVIYCGAAIPFENISQLPPALAFAGVRDMNYTEVMASGSALDEKKITHAMIEWKGKHEWPDSVSFEDAFYWCSFVAMKNKSIAADQKLIKTFLQKKNKQQATAKDDLSRFNLDKEVVAFLYNLTDVSPYLAKIKSLMQSPAYQKELQQQQNILQSESSLKQNYVQSFETKDMGWWKSEIAKIRSLKSGPQEMMYQRILGYISLASYSYSNNAIKQNNFPAAQQFLAIYKLADPENSEQPFLTACMYARQGDQQKALDALKKALQLGLKDRAKIENEESFSSLRSNPEFSQLLSGI
jgi:predicted esterase